MLRHFSGGASRFFIYGGGALLRRIMDRRCDGGNLGAWHLPLSSAATPKEVIITAAYYAREKTAKRTFAAAAKEYGIIENRKSLKRFSSHVGEHDGAEHNK